MESKWDAIGLVKPEEIKQLKTRNQRGDCNEIEKLTIAKMDFLTRYFKPEYHAKIEYHHYSGRMSNPSMESKRRYKWFHSGDEKQRVEHDLIRREEARDQSDLTGIQGDGARMVTARQLFHAIGIEGKAGEVFDRSRLDDPLVHNLLLKFRTMSLTNSTSSKPVYMFKNVMNWLGITTYVDRKTSDCTRNSFVQLLGKETVFEMMQDYQFRSPKINLVLDNFVKRN
jgi:hypothetical protein